MANEIEADAFLLLTESTVAVMFPTVAALEVFKALIFPSDQNGLLNTAL